MDVEFAHGPVQKPKKRGLTGRLICEPRIHPVTSSEPRSRSCSFERRNGSLMAILRRYRFDSGRPADDKRQAHYRYIGLEGRSGSKHHYAQQYDAC